jgi:excisionase family DNA binding protein
MAMQFKTYPGITAHLNERGIPISEGNVRKMVMQDRIPYTKLGKRVLFDVEKVDSWVASHSVEPGASR